MPHDPAVCPCNKCSARRQTMREEAAKAATHQPPPVVNDMPSVQDQVIADLQARKEVGLARYGTLLQPNNGRDALMDAYQESLDLAIYLRQVIMERDLNAPPVPRSVPGYVDHSENDE